MLFLRLSELSVSIHNGFYLGFGIRKMTREMTGWGCTTNMGIIFDSMMWAQPN